MSDERLTSERGDDGGFAILGQHGVSDGFDSLPFLLLDAAFSATFCYRDTTFAIGEESMKRLLVSFHSFLGLTMCYTFTSRLMTSRMRKRLVPSKAFP